MINQQSNVALIILAAGESKRMGQPKQLLPWKKTTLLGHCIDQAKKSKINDIYVILGAHYDAIYKAHKQDSIAFLYNPNWKYDLGNTIAFAITHLLKENYSGALLLLADQPLVNSEYINKLYSTFKSNRTIVATCYNGNKNYGIPILFGQAFFNDLIKNSHPKGAKPLLEQFQKHIIPMHPIVPIQDLDTIEDYQDLYRLFHKLS